MENTNVLMKGKAVIKLSTSTNNPMLFKQVINPSTIIEARLVIISSEFEAITIPVSDFLEFEWREDK